MPRFKVKTITTIETHYIVEADTHGEARNIIEDELMVGGELPEPVWMGNGDEEIMGSGGVVELADGE